MRRSARILWAATCTVSVLAAAVSVKARSNPIQPKLASSPQAAQAAIQFDCGTYKGNQTESARLSHRYTSHLQSVSATPSADYIYEDIWVVEDDGTILVQGNNPFDAHLQTARFIPNVAGGYDVGFAERSYDAVLGTDLSLADDGNATVGIGFDFDFFGVTWTDVHVNSNGVVAFGDDLSQSGFYDAQEFFNSLPKIAAYFLDLDPTSGGGVFYKSETTKTTITWAAVPEFNTSNFNTFQLVFYDDDHFDITFTSIATNSQTNGVPIAVGNSPGAAGGLEIVDLTADLPHSSGLGIGVYEEFLNIPNPSVNDVAMMQRFYQSFPDEFFQTVFFTNFTQTMGGFANEQNIMNNIQGIGLGQFDNSGLYGSNGVLESRCNMNQIAAWPSDPFQRFLGPGGNSFLTVMGQESGHRWGAFMNFEDSDGNVSNLILGRSDAHWSYYADVDHSCLEGGDWKFVQGSLYTTPTWVDYFGDLDEYTFGVRTPEEVTEFFYVSSASNNLAPNRSASPPGMGVNATGVPIEVTIDNIIAAEGPRVPSERPDKDLRQAFIMVHKNGLPPTTAELDKLVNFRRVWEDYFEVAVDGRLSLNTSLTQTFPVGVIEGHISDGHRGGPVENVSIRSLERGFVQNVTQGGRYTFRYMADEDSGTTEPVTLLIIAFGFIPKTVVLSTEYGTTQTIDIDLQPDFTPATVQNYDIAWIGHAVELTWALFDVEGALSFEIYRSVGLRPLSRLHGAEVLRDKNSFTFVDEEALPGFQYRYKVVILEDGIPVTSFEMEVETPALSTALHQNQPNPFNPVTTIPFVLGESESVTLAVYDIRGKLVRVLHEGNMGPGFKSIEWDGKDTVGNPVSSGAYFYRLQAGRDVQTRKMVLLK